MRVTLFVFIAACSDNATVLPDAAPVAENGVTYCNKPTVYLETRGITLVGATEDDAVASATRLVTAGSERVIEPVAEPSAVVIDDLVLAALAEHGIPTVTTRPSSGPYVLVAVDGDLSGWESIPQSTFQSPQDCADAVASNIVLINHRAHDGYPTAAITTSIKFALGVTLGLDPSLGPADDCMRYDAPADRCSFYDGVAVDTRYARCATGTQDQRSTVQARLGC